MIYSVQSVFDFVCIPPVKEAVSMNLGIANDVYNGGIFLNT